MGGDCCELLQFQVALLQTLGIALDFSLGLLVIRDVNE